VHLLFHFRGLINIMCSCLYFISLLNCPELN
jgi:hypothetical protein